MTKDEALDLALEALDILKIHFTQNRHVNEAITAIKQARSAPVQEPVAWMYWQSCLNDDGTQTAPWVQRYSKFKPPESVINKEITPLYTTPPAQPAPVQEPVAIVDEDGVIVVCNYKYKPGDKLYTTPPAAQRQWVGLDDDDISALGLSIAKAKALESLLKRRNT